MVKVSLFTNTHTNQTRPSSLDLAVRGMIVSADKITESNRPPSLRFDCPCLNSQPRADPHACWSKGYPHGRMGWDGRPPGLLPCFGARLTGAKRRRARAGGGAGASTLARRRHLRPCACLPFRSPSPDICPIIRRDGQTSRPSLGTIDHTVRCARDCCWSGVREKYYWLTGGWRLLLE